jgi:hypothetical protein
MADELLQQNQSDVLVAGGAATQRGPKPGGPNPNDCKRILHDIVVYLTGGTLQNMVNPDVGKTLSRGLIERYFQMRNDSWKLWEAGDRGIDGIGSWKGHKDLYNKMRNDLKNLLEAWDRGKCDDLDGGLGGLSQAQVQEILQKARVMANQNPPAAPDRIFEQERQRQQDGFRWPELPQIEIPDWIWIIPRLLWDPARADSGQQNQENIAQLPNVKAVALGNPNQDISEEPKASDPPTPAEIDAYIAQVNPGNFELLQRTQQWAASLDRFKEDQVGPAHTEVRNVAVVTATQVKTQGDDGGMELG